MTLTQATSIRVGQTIFVAGVAQTVQRVQRRWRRVRIVTMYAHSAFDGQTFAIQHDVQRNAMLFVMA